MSAQPQLQPEIESAADERPRWNWATRVAFRFAVAYFGLFSLTTQVLSGLFPNPKVEVPDLGVLTPVRQIVLWTGAHVFHITKAMVYQGSGSGDKTYDWVLAFCTLVTAAAATVVWSALDRGRVNYAAMHRWFYVAMRFALGSEVLLYGVDKLVPLQMPFPFLTRLVQPFGTFSPMGVLWTSIGASPGYEMFAGAAEALGGILLFFPRTATLGALVCLADMTEVFTLNMTYDVPVKLFAFHLILLALVLLAPEAGRLARFFFSNGEAGAPAQRLLFQTARANRIALGVQIGCGLLLIAGNGFNARKSWYQYGGGAAKPALYGIWNVERGQAGAGASNGAAKGAAFWRRLIFDRAGVGVVQSVDDAMVYYAATIDEAHGKISLLGRDRKAYFQYERRGANRLVLDGVMDGEKAHLELELVDRGKMMLVNRGFHWIQEYPFNR